MERPRAKYKLIPRIVNQLTFFWRGALESRIGREFRPEVLREFWGRFLVVGGGFGANRGSQPITRLSSSLTTSKRSL